MKTRTALNVALAALLCSLFSCSQPQKAESQVITALDSLKAHYAPDRRVAVFDVSCVQQGSVVLLKGEVDNPKVKEDVMSLVHRTLGGQTIDSLKVLPDPELGEKRFGIVADAAQKCDPDGDLVDEETRERLRTFLAAFADWIRLVGQK